MKNVYIQPQLKAFEWSKAPLVCASPPQSAGLSKESQVNDVALSRGIGFDDFDDEE